MKLSILVVYIILSILSTSELIYAWVYPTSPETDSVCTPGSNITVLWKDDGKSPNIATKSIKVYFMSGSDQQQIYLATIGEDIPASQCSINYPCPQVDPVGKWYFFRFSDGNTTNDAYTTRFTITDLNGKYPPAPSPAPAPGKNPGQNGKIVSNSTNSATDPSTNGTSTSTPTSTQPSSNDNTSNSSNKNVPAVVTGQSAPSKTVPSSAKLTKQSGSADSDKASATGSAPSNIASNVSSSASFLEYTKKLMFSVIVGLTLSFLMLHI
ncbi:22458_t:CDS:2 [Dentiscutata erythropus]|uniref:22458_t:CDS:1 n=1 Tax=Dentiscutata erythropus TaxID=1348616 RepID=A0A9N9DDX3_9GLOM|nr:22458_t:CDS:2 [Dentiscutata erythropus]